MTEEIRDIPRYVTHQISALGDRTQDDVQIKEASLPASFLDSIEESTDYAEDLER